MSDDTRLCPCGSGRRAAPQYDARGMFLCRTCDECHQRKLATYRKDVLTDPDYWHDEPLEED